MGGGGVDLPQVYFINQKKLGKGKFVSGRLITDDEIDLGQVYGGGLEQSRYRLFIWCSQWMTAIGITGKSPSFLLFLDCGSLHRGSAAVINGQM